MKFWAKYLFGLLEAVLFKVSTIASFLNCYTLSLSESVKYMIHLRVVFAGNKTSWFGGGLAVLVSLAACRCSL